MKQYAAPKVVIYDNACNLHQYMLNREPLFFKSTWLLVDRFHWPNHTGIIKISIWLRTYSASWTEAFSNLSFYLISVQPLSFPQKGGRGGYIVTTPLSVSLLASSYDRESSSIRSLSPLIVPPPLHVLPPPPLSFFCLPRHWFYPSISC